ncbi:MAG: ribonuclease HII [Pseudomonadota bacterium]|nr:MAG: ribonuclease HII [Pseudomonadota bacterium]
MRRARYSSWSGMLRIVPDPTRGPVAGVDEAGRGPLAGPVVAAAVVLDPARPVAGLADSKQLSAVRREQLAGQIRARALAVGVARVEADEIDRINILQASLKAMCLAVGALGLDPVLVRVDGNQAPSMPWPVQTVVGGDRSDRSIAAASIVAKVERDRIMVALHEQYPDYGFDRHKGYPTRAHRSAIERLGPCPAHRRSFRPLRQYRLF